MPTASARALSLADDLERWIQLASRSTLGRRPENVRCAEVNTDITMQEMDEWDQVEAEMSPEEREFDEQADSVPVRLREVAEEEQRLSEEFSNLKAQIKQEKAFNHQQSQAHQQQVRKLKVALNKRKKEAEAKEQQQRKDEEKAKQAREETDREEAKLQEQLHQARELNQKLKDKLQESSEVNTNRSKVNNFRTQIHTLKCYLMEEHEKEQLLKQELDKVAEEESRILTETKQCKAKVRLLTQQATMLKQMVNCSSAELEGWNEQMERLQIRKQEARDTAKERQVMEKCAKKYQRRQLGLPDEKDSEGKTIPSNPSVSRTSSRSTGLSLKETNVTYFGKGTVKKSVVECDNTTNPTNPQ